METQFPELLEAHFLLACSGGLDSVVLAHLCHSLGLSFDLAHCNFSLRGTDSDQDANFVSELANELGIKCFLKTFNTEEYASKYKASIQESARALRYRWFHELLDEGKGAYLVTAHHADDDLETFLINLSRVTGLEGLCGIPRRNGPILRPLLPFSREALEAYAKDHAIRWREDRSNAGLDYLRNRFRHLAVPGLKQADPDFLSQFSKSLEFLRGNREMLANHMARVRASLLDHSADGIRISLDKLLALNPLEAYLHALLQEYGFRDWAAISRLVTGPSGKAVFSASHRLLKTPEALLVLPLREESATEYPVGDGLHPEGLPIHLRMETVSRMGETSPAILYTDKETLKQGLTLRKWKKGDYFYPLGMQGRKKVAKFFRDSHLDRRQRESAWLLCSGPDIVWILGLRADARFRVTDQTSEILKITWEDPITYS
ncbi:tRNA lysidine(34) synthetase TilS [Robiginitalea sediminis]|uniref:tRNA lysidine(34) synthetase TilS n=1 Tax=Robiginitalea sediminis TaxID=1982593 RepID=UPI001303095A|nr:tRNA lysidine(34) synthetase TilS [Robiginitalea sediminis]